MKTRQENGVAGADLLESRRHGKHTSRPVDHGRAAGACGQNEEGGRFARGARHRGARELQSVAKAEKRPA